MVKKLLAALLAVMLCVTLLAGCSSPNYIWANEAGLKFDMDKLNYADLDPDAVFDENGNLIGIRGLDYVTLPEDLQEIHIPAAAVDISEAELDSYLAAAMQGYAIVEEITDRAVENGDTVNIDYVGSVDGVNFSGGNTQGAGTNVTAGSTEYIDDFLTQIIGHMPGETFDVVVTFPAGYNDSTDEQGNPMQLAGKEAVFKTTINYIAGETTIPECTDEWVTENMSAYGFTTREEVREDLRIYYRARKVYNYVADYLAQNTVYAENNKLPQSLVNFAASNLLQLQYYYATAMNAPSMDDFMQLQGYDSTAAFLDASADDLLEDVHNLLLTQALIEVLGVTLTPEEVQAALGGYYEDYVIKYGSNYTNMYANISQCYSLLTSSAVVDD